MTKGRSASQSTAVTISFAQAQKLPEQNLEHALKNTTRAHSFVQEVAFTMMTHGTGFQREFYTTIQPASKS